MLVRGGRMQSVASVVASALIAVVVAITTPEGAPTAARLAAFGVAVMAVAVTVGSPRLVGVATVPILGSALIVVAAPGEPAWVTATLVGVLWYVAAELAWDAFERRDGIERTRAFTDRRVVEVSSVVLLALLTTAAAFALSGVAPVRTLFVLAGAVVALAYVLGAATSHLRRRSATDAGAE